MSILWVLVSFVGLSMLAVVVALAHRLRQVQTEFTALKQRFESVSTDLHALCAGTVGVDRRITRLESQGRRLDHRQESLENRRQDDRPYGEAIHMIHNGATADRLVEKLGLNRGEAELMVMLHQVPRAC